MQCKSFSHFFNKKYWRISDINILNFNDTLTDDVVSFEQSGPEKERKKWEGDERKENSEMQTVYPMSALLQKSLTHQFKRAISFPIGN